MWDKLSENEFTQVIEDALIERYPDDPPVFMSRTPHGYFDPIEIRAQVEAAGFADAKIERIEHMSRAPSAAFVATAFCQGTPLRSELEARGASLDEITRYSAEALTRRFGKGPIQGRISAWVIEARR